MQEAVNGRSSKLDNKSIAYFKIMSVLKKISLGNGGNGLHLNTIETGT
jgi:hypothetical protein